ncbi:TIGR01777 family oxidoreductase [Candidatus Leptofilum sp.]|uniref:TIGR01777 family oxidoreductase n=1 Tax=Candidatus Leptofilum sp. TaxID=3241576 RepID=UPI003B593DD9
MRVIITGGTGLIGSALAKNLAANGHEVIVLSRNPAKYSFPANVRGEKWDSKTAANWGHLADGADAIVNLAGEPIAGTGLLPSRWTDERKQRIRQSRIDAGTAVTEAIRAATNKPKLLIQSSGVDYYGDTQSDQIITEESPNGNSFLADVTVDWENSTAAVEAMGVRRVIIRTGIVLSMESGALPITALPFKFFAGGPLGNGQQWWPWIHLDDEVRAIRFLLESETAVGPYNLCTPNPLKNKDFAKVLGQVMNRPAFFPAPAFAIKLALGEIAAIVLDGRRAVPKKLEEAGFTFKYPQARNALMDLLNP